MWSGWIDKTLRALADWAGPRRCPWCESPAPVPCAGCVATLPWNRPACDRCAAPLPAGFRHAQTCAECAREPPPQDGAWTAFRYAEPVARQVRALKFHADFAAARVLGDALAASMAARGAPLPDALVPVPLHPSRLRRRGYNQALELGRTVSRRLGIPLRPSLARRLRATAEQTRLGADERRRNLRGAFTVDPAVRGSALAILDDVITTGATAAELAGALRRAGARRVEVWAVARTP